MIEKIKNVKNIEILENVDMKNFNTFKISCIVKALIKPKNIKALINLLKILKYNHIRYKVIGKCSNLIFVNPIFDGVLISLEKFNTCKIINNKVFVGAGYSLMQLAYEVSLKGLSGLEFASGIPGSVGGSVVGNAGAFGSNMSKVVKSIKVLMPDFTIKKFNNKELEFDYRTSFLQYKEDYICLEVEFLLEKKAKEKIFKTIREINKKRKSVQPLSASSAGSVFRNPKNVKAWELIVALGFQGKRIGGAEVSKKHANFIINTGNATGSDVKKLILEIQKSVKEKYNIDLEKEQEFVE